MRSSSTVTNSAFFFARPKLSRRSSPSRCCPAVSARHVHRRPPARLPGSSADLPGGSESPARPWSSRSDRARLSTRAGEGTARADDRGLGFGFLRAGRLDSPAAPRTPAAIPRISRQRACRRSNRVRESDGRLFSIVVSERRRAAARRRRGRSPGCWRAPSHRSPRESAGPKSSPARYASSPAPTSGSSTGASGVSAAAAAPPRKNSRFHRKRNASLR